MNTACCSEREEDERFTAGLNSFKRQEELKQDAVSQRNRKPENNRKLLHMIKHCAAENAARIAQEAAEAAAQAQAELLLQAS